MGPKPLVNQLIGLESKRIYAVDSQIEDELNAIPGMKGKCQRKHTVDMLSLQQA